MPPLQTSSHPAFPSAARRDENDERATRAPAPVEPAPKAPRIFGVSINLPSLSAACEAAMRRARRGQGFTLFTMNLDHLAQIRRSAAFAALYKRATFVSADGWPIVWFAARRGAPLERACGSDLVEPLCAMAAAQAVPAYFVGPGAKAQAIAVDRLRRASPGLVVAGAEAPKFASLADDSSVEEIAGRIRSSGARLCFLSLGAPKQEFLADALLARCPNVGFICVGAALDFISGQTQRAPMWMRRARLEWLWRLSTDPRRLAARYIGCLYVFALFALRGRLVAE